jgi:hypothetical protein
MAYVDILALCGKNRDAPAPEAQLRYLRDSGSNI